MKLLPLLIAAATALLSAAVVSADDGDVVLAPAAGTEDKPAAAFIMAQGASIKPSQYTDLAAALQAAMPDNALWIGIPEFALDTPEPLVLGGGISRVRDALVALGMDNSTKVVLGGHSLGGAMIQDYVADHCPDECVAQVLFAAALTRKHARDSAYSVPTLTLDGELDGLMRVTRQAEAYYHQVLNNKFADPADFPVIIFDGVTHMQFAQGDAPSNVAKNDLKPEVSYDEAHAAIAEATAAFFAVQVFGDSSAQKTLDSGVKATGDFVQPLIDSLELEGFIHFKPPCNSDTPSPHCPFYPAWPLQDSRSPSEETECTCGTPWIQETAQRMMGDLSDAEIEVVDAIHDVSDTHPVHLPHIWNDCGSDNGKCVLNVTTVSMAIYDKLDGMDTGFYYTSASELRVKLVSRQNVQQSFTGEDLDFNVTDAPSICGEINAAAYQWALDNAGEAASKRFAELGEPMVMGDDKGPYNAGPLFIDMPLEYADETDHIEVKAPMMKTETDYFISSAAGFHYCKLLSPARAMEWIYIDGLRLNDSL